MSAKVISKWETGRSIPDTIFLVPLCDALQMRLEFLLEGEETSDSQRTDRGGEAQNGQSLTRVEETAALKLRREANGIEREEGAALLGKEESAAKKNEKENAQKNKNRSASSRNKKAEKILETRGASGKISLPLAPRLGLDRIKKRKGRRQCGKISGKRQK